MNRTAGLSVLLVCLLAAGCFESSESSGCDPGCSAGYDCINGKCVELGPEEQICTPGSDKCVGKEVHRCNQAGSAFLFLEECEHGCSGGKCSAAACVPDCVMKDCGPDGCGGECGHCYSMEGGVDDSLCQADGTCESECIPACVGKECGADGCGDVCGHCYDSDGFADGGLCQIDGTCMDNCVLACVGKECGPDG